MKTGLAVDVPDLGVHRIKSAASLTNVTDIRVERYNKVQLKPEDDGQEGHFAKVRLCAIRLCVHQPPAFSTHDMRMSPL